MSIQWPRQSILFKLIIFFKYLFLLSLSSADVMQEARWSNDLVVKAPASWQESSFWQGAIPVVRWRLSKHSARILVQKFGDHSPFPTPEEFLQSPLARTKEKPPLLVKEMEVGGISSKVYERVYDEVNLDYDQADAPPKVRFRQVLREQIVILSLKNEFYVIRYSAVPWEFRKFQNEWKGFLSKFLIN